MDMNAEYQKELDSTMVSFPVGKEWINAALNALKFSSPISMGVSSPEIRTYVEKLKNGGDLTMYEFAVLNNNILSRTPNDLNLSMNIYLDVMDMVFEYTKTWNEESELMRNGILQRAVGDSLKNPLAKA